MKSITARYRHKKRGGVYDCVSHASLQTDKPIEDGCDLVIYQGEDGKWWARPTAEFHDGRFEVVRE